MKTLKKIAIAVWVFVAFVVVLVVCLVWAVHDNAHTTDAHAALIEAKRLRAVKLAEAELAFKNLTPAEHLQKANQLLEPNHSNIDEAYRHLEAIPETAPEYKKAFPLMVSVEWKRVIRDGQERQLAEERRQQQEQLRLQREQEAAARRQRKIDGDAEWRSYFPTTVRVDTDMNSFWLDQEERNCISYPDKKNKVYMVSCSSTASETHNIPVTFWGGVERGIVSDWKCRREGEKFVCRAVD